MTLPRSTLLQRLPWLVLIALPLTCVVMPLLITAIEIFSQMPAAITLVVLAVLLALTWFVVGRVRQPHLRKWQARFSDQLEREGLAQTLAAQVREAPQHVDRLVSAVLRLARAQGTYAGTTIRIGPPDTPPVAPFLQAFEARQLNEREAPFTELAGAADALSAMRREPESPKRSWVELSHRHRLLLALMPGIAFMLSSFVHSAMNGRLASDGRLLIFGAALVGGGLLTLVLAPLKPAWFVVPGGVLVRQLRLQSPVELYRYDRRESLLIASYVNRMWVVSITDPRRADDRAVSPTELDILLRAWLSPLAPPALETLSDLR